MSKSKELLKSTYEEIIRSFPTAKLEYQQSELTNTHFVKITPQDIYDSQEFSRLEADMYQKWVDFEIETGESLCFVSGDSLINLDNPEIVYEPQYFGVKIVLDWLNFVNKESCAPLPMERSYNILGYEVLPSLSDPCLKLAA